MLQTGMRPREQRRTVVIPARMRTGAAWVDVCIHNVSSRGLLIATDAPPAAGTYVDIRRGSVIIIGRAMWTKGRFAGVRAQDRIDIHGLMNASRAPRPDHVGGTGPAANVERRSGNRMSSDAATARRLERSRQRSSMLQFLLVVVAGACVAGMLATHVYDILAAPFAAATAQLSP